MCCFHVRRVERHIKAQWELDVTLFFPLPKEETNFVYTTGTRECVTASRQHTNKKL